MKWPRGPPSHLSATAVGVVASSCLVAVWPDEPRAVGRHSEQIVARQGAHRVVPSPSSAVEIRRVCSFWWFPRSLGHNVCEGTSTTSGCGGTFLVLDDDKLKEDAIGALRQAFYANTSRPAQSQKRRDVEDVAEELREGATFTLSKGGGLAGEWLQECGLVHGPGVVGQNVVSVQAGSPSR